MEVVFKSGGGEYKILAKEKQDDNKECEKI